MEFITTGVSSLLDLILAATCIFLLFVVYCLREGHKILENQIRSLAGFFDEKLSVLEQNFMSYVDFSDQNLSELKAEAERLQFFEKLVYSWAEDVEKLTSLMNYQHDTLRYDMYRHMYGYYHLDENRKPIKPEPIVEREFNMAQLKDSIEERSRQYGIPMGAQFYRHREEKPE